MVRLAAVDLDGTLLRTDGTVSERSRVAIAAARAAGVEVVIVTARSPRTVRHLALQAGIDGEAICANGATLYDLDADRIVAHHPLDAALAARIAAELRAAFPEVVFGWELELRFGSEPAYEALRDPTWWPRPSSAFDPVPVDTWNRPMTKLLARLPNGELDALLELAHEVCGTDAEATLTGEAFVEVMAAGVNKGAALARFATARGLAATHVVAVGDHVTDAGMLRWAGRGVAVANAHPAAVEAADEVTVSNDDDGVAVVLEAIVRAAGVAT